MSRWTSVVSWHTDPDSCGVARFSKQLAERLGVPHIGVTEDGVAWGERPLLSAKWAEWEYFGESWANYDQLWHDEPPDWVAPLLTGRVWKLYEIGVPALVQPVHMAGLALFTFGMAHKAQAHLFHQLRQRVPMETELWISTSEHEGAGPSQVPALMAAWGDGCRNLGHLTDDALALVWPRVAALVAFFAHGLRANNTTVHAALDAGVPVITNWGSETPGDLKARTHDLFDFPRNLNMVRPIGSPYTWTRLLKELGCENSS